MSNTLFTKPRAIDIHIHLGTPGPVPSDEELRRCVAEARRHGIERIVLLGNVTAMGGANPTPEDISALNTHTLGVLERYPDVFIGFCYLNPSHDDAFNQAEIERCLANGPMTGIKLWIAVKATDSRLDPIMAAARRLGAPVLHHAWYKATVFAFNESTPAEVAELGRRHPDVTLIMAHLGGGGCRGVRDIEDVPNIVIDTSGAQPEAGLVEYAVKRLGVERVVFGSDWPGRDFAVQLGRVYGAPLTPAERQAVLYDNAARILGLEAKP